MLADSRVSFQGGKFYDRLNGVQKIITIHNDWNYISLGYCGSIDGAKVITRYIRNQLVKFNESLAMPYFAYRVQEWIVDATKKLTLEQSKVELALFACDPEPIRVPTSDGKIISLPIYQHYSFIYSIREPGIVDMRLGGEVEVIGSGNSQKALVESLNYHKRRLFAAGAAHDYLLAMSTLMTVRDVFLKEKNRTVGGAWQVVGFSPNYRFYEEFHWLTSTGSIDNDIGSSKWGAKNYELKRKSTNEVYKIYFPEDWESSGKYADMEEF